MRQSAILLVVLALGGCAGSEAHNRILEHENVLNVLPSSDPAYDYVVTLRNKQDFGFDPDDKATRHRTALAALKAQCPQGRVVGERVVNTGEYALGKKARTYFMHVKC